MNLVKMTPLVTLFWWKAKISCIGYKTVQSCEKVYSMIQEIIKPPLIELF